MKYTIKPVFEARRLIRLVIRKWYYENAKILTVALIKVLAKEIRFLLELICQILTKQKVEKLGCSLRIQDLGYTNLPTQQHIVIEEVDLHMLETHCLIVSLW